MFKQDVELKRKGLDSDDNTIMTVIRFTFQSFRNPPVNEPVASQQVQCAWYIA